MSIMNIKKIETDYGNWTIPYYIINSNKAGKNVLIVSGIHGNERVGRNSLNSVKKYIENNIKAGSVTIIPIVNTPAYYYSERGWNDIDLNRSFDDTNNQYHDIIKWLLQIFENNDYLIDIHSGNDTDMIDTYWRADINHIKSLQLGIMTGFQGLLYNNIKGSLRAAFLDYNTNGSAITIESGGSRQVDINNINDINILIKNVLASLDVCDGEIILTKSDNIGRQINILTNSISTINYIKSLGDYILKGEDFIKLDDNILKSPISGKLIHLNSLNNTSDGFICGILVKHNHPYKYDNIIIN